jgi:Ca2+-binding RTX toxin-like protein
MSTRPETISSDNTLNSTPKIHPAVLTNIITDSTGWLSPPVKRSRGTTHQKPDTIDSPTADKLDEVGDFNEDGSFSTNMTLLMPVVGIALPFVQDAMNLALKSLMGDADIGIKNMTATLAADRNVYVSGQLNNGNRVMLVVGNTVALDYLATGGLDLGSLIPNVSLLQGLGLSSVEMTLASGDVSFTNPDLDSVEVGRGLTLIGVLDLKGAGNKIFNFINDYTRIDSLSVQTNLDIEEGLSLSGQLNTDLSLMRFGAFSITQRNVSLDFSISPDLEPAIGMTNTLELTGYDPTQTGEPTLTLSGGFSFEPESVSLFAAMDTNGLAGWKNPFGFNNAEIRTAGFQLGATYLAPYVDNIGLVMDARWDQYDISFGGSMDVNDPESIAFTLTINQDINIVRMMAQMQSMALGPEAARLFSLTKGLFNSIPLTMRSFDSDNDGTLDPFISFVPFPTEIAGLALDEGIGINARVNLGGQIGELALNSSPDFMEMSGSLRISNLVLGDWLVISGTQPGSDLTARFEISPAEQYFNGDGKITVLGQTLAQAYFSVSSSGIAINDTKLPLIPAVLNLNIDSLDVDFNALTANGKTSMVLLGREMAGLDFSMNSQKINVTGNFDLGALDIIGNMVWDTNQRDLNISGSLSINNVNLAATQVTYDNGALNISGKIGVTLPNIGSVDTRIKAKYTSTGLAISASADLGALGTPKISIAANDFSASTIATRLYNQAISEVGALPDYMAATVTDGLTDVFRAGSYVYSASQIDNQIKKVIKEIGGTLKSIFGGKGEHNKTYVDTRGISENWKGNGGNDVAVGNAGDDSLKAHQGNDLVDGGAGNDTLEGGQDQDMMYGGDGNDIIEGQAGSDVIYGGLGADSIDGSGKDFDNGGKQYRDKNDEIHGGPGNDTIYGSEGADTIWGDGGDDMLWGDRVDRSDSNTMDTVYGGAGDDIYFMVSGSDIFIENAEEGTDTVYSAIHYTLPANIENLTLMIPFTNGYGNALDNIITGSPGSNKLSGGQGNDSYFVDAFDTVIEAENAGYDTVYSPVNNTLPEHVEKLALTGTAAVNGTGNALDNVLMGNGAANVLRGGSGNDSYYVDTQDTVVEQANDGVDTVYVSSDYDLRQKTSHVENLTLTGNANGSWLVGNDMANVLTGNAGANFLDGITGADTLTGGPGADVFRLFGADISNTRTLTDFSAADDTLHLSGSLFSRLGVAGTFSAGNFVIGTVPDEADDYLIYNPGTGDLFYDVDGNGANLSTRIAVLPVGLSLTHQDFVVV